jgi:septal ring factor EnvC (AmiA/AmiB activator)
MNSPLVLALVGMAGILITALFTYLGTKRKGGGTIKTSEAADLWGQTQALLHQLSDEAAASRAESAELRKELEEVRRELRTLRDQLVRIQASGALT